MSKTLLPTVGAQREGIGDATIMSSALAARYGVAYVHMAVFAIDIDRVHEIADDEDDAWPFGWEVFLTEQYLLAHVQPTEEAHHVMIEETCLAIHNASEKEIVLGSQLPFAVYDAVRRGVWPSDLVDVFRPWRKRADILVKRLAPLWQSPADYSDALAEACLEAPLDPPLAPPTIRALEAMRSTA